MITSRSQKIGRLRGVCQNETESPLERLKASERLLIDFGPSEGSVPIIRRVITAFERNADPKISERTQKLKIKLSKAMDLRREAAKADIGPSVEEPIVAGTSARCVKLTRQSLISVQEEQLGDSWHWPENDFSTESRLGLLEAVLDSKVTTGGVQSLLAELQKRNLDGWSLAISFPLIVRFAKEYLTQNGVTPVPEDNAQSLKDQKDFELRMSL